MIDVDKLLEEMTPEQRAKALAAAESYIKLNKFIPSPGPQREAYESQADVLLYGGSGGSGKTSLINGLAQTRHRRSLIMRRHYGELSALIDDAIKFNGSRDGYNGSPPPSLTTKDGRFIEFGACQYSGDEQKFQGKAHDFLGLDEVVAFFEAQVRFLMGWVRTTDINQRCRVVMATNPPLSSEGDWVIGMFRPWLDITHPNPAKSGELRWYVTDPDGKDVEVLDNKPKEFGKQTVIPTSRTFISGKLSDNPYLARTDYAARLDALPEPLRSAIRDGNFMASRKDQVNQCIPAEWIMLAMDRWTKNPPVGVPQCAIGVDCAMGGDDCTVLAIRHDGWFDNLESVPGKLTPYGRDIAGLIISRRRDNAVVILDMGGGYGSGAYECLVANNIKPVAYKGGESATSRTRDGTLKFKNKRTQAYWKFREALDPSQPGGSSIMLPNDPELMAELSAPKFEITAESIILEKKEDVVARIGRSTDKGDSVVMAYFSGDRLSDSFGQWKNKNSRPNSYQGSLHRK